MPEQMQHYCGHVRSRSRHAGHLLAGQVSKSLVLLSHRPTTDCRARRERKTLLRIEMLRGGRLVGTQGWTVFQIPSLPDGISDTVHPLASWAAGPSCLGSCPAMARRSGTALRPSLASNLFPAGTWEPRHLASGQPLVWRRRGRRGGAQRGGTAACGRHGARAQSSSRDVGGRIICVT